MAITDSTGRPDPAGRPDGNDAKLFGGHRPVFFPPAAIHENLLTAEGGNQRQRYRSKPGTMAKQGNGYSAEIRKSQDVPNQLLDGIIRMHICPE